MALSDKVNLQVKVAAYASNYVQYAFKIISYENKTINLNNYRIVCYFNTFRSHDVFVQSRILAGYGYNGTSGSLDNAAGYTSQEFFTVDHPPKIYPTNKRYDKEIILPLTGTAAIISAGGWWENILYQISFNTGQYFISENIGDPSYLIGQLALSEGYSYVPVSQTTYTDNDTFILEYNDPTYGWVKVLEYSNASTLDPNSGKYPYDTIFEAQKAIGNVNRRFGWDTNYDHDGILATYDGYIDQANPTSAFSNTTTYSLNGSGVGGSQTRIGLYKFATTALAEKTVSAAEFYVFQPASNQVVTVDCRINLIDYDGNATWDAMSGWEGTSGAIQSQLYIDVPYQFQNSYIAYNMDKNVVQGWQDSSATNFGINLRYNDITDKAGYNAPTMNTLENSAAYKPTLFVYSGPVSASESRYIRWKGTTNNLWSEATNWENEIVPTADDYVVFDEAYYTNPCVLDIDDSVKNILGTSATYTGSINLSSHSLTIYETTSAFDISNFNNFNASSATIELKGNINANVPAAIFIKKLIISTGATLLTEEIIVGTLQIKNSSTLQSLISHTRLYIRDSIIFDIGNETISNLQLYIEKGAIIPNNGHLNATNIKYIGSSKITARTYNCPVSYVIPQESDYSYETFCSAYFVSAGACNFNQGFYVINNSYHSSGSAACILDFNSNGNSFYFNSFNMGIESDHSEHINMIFPTGDVGLNGNLVINASMISATSNFENCTFVMTNNNTISQGATLIGKRINFPKLKKIDTGIVTLNASAPLNNVSFESIDFGSLQNYVAPTINFNSAKLQSNSLLTVVSNLNNIQNIGGSILSGTNIYFYKDNSSNGFLVGATPWSANALNALQADGVTLANSIATSATGYAICSTDFGGNVNWQFGTIPPIILETSANPSHYSQTPISAYYSITDEGGLDANTVTITNGFGDLLNLVQHSSTSATFMVVISGTQRFGQIEISAADYSGNNVEFTSLPFSFDNTAPNVIINSYSPATGASDSFINLIVSAHDNCILSGSQQVFAATFNNQPAQIRSINYSDNQNATATIKLSSSMPVTNGDLYISATDAALNTTVLYSSAFTIATSAPQITFENSPNFKIGSTIIQVSAIFEDPIGMSTTIPYIMKYNDLNIPFSTIYDSTTKVILSAVIPSSSGTGSISVTGFNVAGVSATGIETGYSFIPVIIFGDPIPSNISKTTITVPISAVGAFLDDANYYYVRLSNTRMPISEPTSGVLNIFGYDFEYLSFSATVSSMTDLYGDLIISAGYR